MAKVLCVDANDVAWLPHGFTAGVRLLPGRLHCEFVEREQAEKDPAWKQLIPYVVVLSQGKVLAYQRSKQSGEKRLVDRWSVGWGGHIDEFRDDAGADFTAEDAIAHSMDREMKEELGVSAHCTPLGLVNDTSNSVGRVHLGLVYRGRVPMNQFLTFGKEVAHHKWFDQADSRRWLKAHNMLPEGWSEMVMRWLVEKPETYWW